VDKNCFQKGSYLKPRCKPRCKPSRGISHSLSAPQAPLQSNHWTCPYFRSEIVILHSASAPFRTTNSGRSRLNWYSLRSCFLSWPLACKAGGHLFSIRSAHDPNPRPANFVRLPPKPSGVRSAHSPLQMSPRPDRHNLHQNNEPILNKSLPWTFPAPSPPPGRALISTRLPFPFGRRFALPSIEAAPDLT